MIDEERHCVSGVRLTLQEWRAFQVLYGRRGHVVPTRDLIKQVWQVDFPPLNQPRTRTLAWALRRKLAGSPYKITTHVNIGLELQDDSLAPVRAA